MSTVTAFISLGLHDRNGDPLTLCEQSAATSLVADCIGHARGKVSGRFRDGEGIWEGQSEPCTAWLVLIEPAGLDTLRTTLARVAGRYRQDSIGLVVHGPDGTGPSYVDAVPS